MSEFTRGPWVLIKSTPEEGSELFYIKAQPHSALRGFSKVVCEVQGPQDDSVQAANANLIAAAPDMLEALVELTAMVERQPDFNDDGDGLTLSRCYEAIEKAKGE